MIEIKNVSLFFNKGTSAQTQALKNINLHIAEGEFVIFIGGNGAGKSTLLSSLCGELIPDEGALFIAGQEVTRWTIAQRAPLLARVFQDPLSATCGDLSIEENLSLAMQRGRRRTLSKALTKEMDKEYCSLLSSLNLNLHSRLQDPTCLLSGGQRQALSLLMATAAPMKALILDEHTAALDPKTADFVLSFTKQLVLEKKLTTLMVTHSLHQAIEYGDRLIMMHQGEIVMDVRGKEKQKLQPADLLHMFHEL